MSGLPQPPEPLAVAPADRARCIHCGTPFRPTPDRPEFCCAGCQYVLGLLHDRGLERYYDLRDGVGMPVGSQVFHARDTGWLKALQEAEEAAGRSRLRLGIQGISCVGCVWLLERLFRERAGAVGSRVNASAGLIDLEWEPGRCDLAGFSVEGLAGANPGAAA